MSWRPRGLGDSVGRRRSERGSRVSTYTIAPGDRALHRKVTAANVVDTVNLPTPNRRVEVIATGDAELFVQEDGAAPTVDGPDAWRFPAGGPTTRELLVRGSVLKLISPGAATYSVTVIG